MISYCSSLVYDFKSPPTERRGLCSLPLNRDRLVMCLSPAEGDGSDAEWLPRLRHKRHTFCSVHWLSWVQSHCAVTRPMRGPFWKEAQTGPHSKTSWRDMGNSGGGRERCAPTRSCSASLMPQLQAPPDNPKTTTQLNPWIHGQRNKMIAVI